MPTAGAADCAGAPVKLRKKVSHEGSTLLGSFSHERWSSSRYTLQRGGREEGGREEEAERRRKQQTRVGTHGCGIQLLDEREQAGVE